MPPSSVGESIRRKAGLNEACSSCSKERGKVTDQLLGAESEEGSSPLRGIHIWDPLPRQPTLPKNIRRTTAEASGLRTKARGARVAVAAEVMARISNRMPQPEERINVGGYGGNDWGDQSKVVADLKRQVQALHEDSIQILRQEVSFVVFLRTGVEASIVGPLATARAAWTRQKEQDPKSLTKPMRATMFACWMNELLARAIGLPSKPEAVKKLVGLKWLDEEGTGWRYLKWDQEAKILVPDEARAVVAATQAVEILQDVLKCSMDSTAITRFFPTRPLTPELKGEAITMILQFALRGESSGRLIQHMHSLSGLAITQLCASQLRPERSQRSGLAVAISKKLAT